MRRRGRSVEPNVNSPEQRLVLSVIEQAMQDVVNPRASVGWWEGKKTRDRTRLREEAKQVREEAFQWLFVSQSSQPMSYRWCVEMVGMPMEVIRKRLCREHPGLMAWLGR